MLPGMAFNARPPPKPNASGPNLAGTPVPSRHLQTRADISALMIGENGPVKTAREARRWLDLKGWVLSGDTYDRAKLVRVLMTAALNFTNKSTESRTDAKHAVLAVAFLLEDDITDSISDALADAVAAKTLSRLESATDKLTSSAAFSSATDTQQAETTLALKTVSTQLADVTTSLNLLAAKMSTSIAPPPPSQPTWASVAGTEPRPSPPPQLPTTTFNPSAPDQHTRLQQRLLRAARTILIEANPVDDLAPTDRSPTGNYLLREAMNKDLAGIDTSLAANGYITDEGDSTPEPGTKTLIRGISSLDRGAYLFEMDSAESAHRFRQYANDAHLGLLKPHLGSSAKVKAKAHNLIFRFVPCGGIFDPSLEEHRDSIEFDNDLSPKSIVSATWLKRIDRRSPKQNVASLKVVCANAEDANRLLQGRIFVKGHVVAVRKDLREPIRCNKCQLYGHVRNTCKSPERCASCASAEHPTTGCPTNFTPRCVSCGTDSSHSSSSRSCPTFKKLCDDLETRFPENSMPFFPTGEAWTWTAAPTKLSNVTPIHRPRVEHGLPPKPAPQAALAHPAAEPAQRPRRQGTLDEFVVPTAVGSQKGRRRRANSTPSPSQ
ncbi:hypothetical protein D9615_008638 [Tricholomella constricta]|uniref:Nucleic-acid-binding protein from transposon X-element n=1 Tax=Tricholomella constricta TaxID=117010 RepID=A0A8H5H445_9AGAR|nr:hypothetical protein D9615_008638 [Tricholomella constricta]